MATSGAKLDHAYKITQVLMVPTLALLAWFATGMVNGIRETQAETSRQITRADKNLTDTAITLERALTSLDKRVVAIEATRFTLKDGAAIQSVLTEMWKEIADRPRSGDVPPSWFLERVKKIEIQLEKLQEKIK